MMPSSLGTDKLDERWYSGMWCGIADEPGEYIIGTKGGMVKVRTFRCES